MAATSLCIQTSKKALYFNAVNSIVNCCTFCVPETICGRYEKQLLRDLMVDYDPLERPVINESSSIMVTFGITLQQIIDVVSLLLPPPIQQHTLQIKRQLEMH